LQREHVELAVLQMEVVGHGHILRSYTWLTVE